MMGFYHLTKQVYVGIFCNCLESSIVYSTLQKPYLNAGLRKELTWLFSSAERKPLHEVPC